MIRIVPLAFIALLAANGDYALAQGEPAAEQRPCPRVQGILYNEDDSNRFMLDPAGTMKPERLDRLVDDLAGSAGHGHADLLQRQEHRLREPRVGRPRPRLRPGPRQPATLLRRHARVGPRRAPPLGAQLPAHALGGRRPHAADDRPLPPEGDPPVGQHADERRARRPPRPLSPAQPLLARAPRLLALPRSVHRVERPVPELRPRAGARACSGPDPRGVRALRRRRPGA